MGKELPQTCALCGKPLRYASNNKKAAIQGLHCGANTHDHDAKSEAHLGHVGGARSRDEFRKLSQKAWAEMGVKDPTKSMILCFECHEIVLHNPVLSEGQMARLGILFKGRGLEEKVVLLNRIIEDGLAAADRPRSSDSVAGKRELGVTSPKI